MNKNLCCLAAILLPFIVTAQPALAVVQINGANICQYSQVSSDILTATVTDAAGNPKPYTGVSFSVVSSPNAAFTYPVTYTDARGVAATVLSFKVAQRGFVWVTFRIIGTLRSVGIEYFIVLGSSVKGNVDEACAHMV